MVPTIGEAVSEDAEAARRLGSLTQRSDAAGIAQLAGHVGTLVVTGFLVRISVGTYWLPLALLVQGIVLVFLFAPLHETIHRMVFRSRRINTAVSWICGAVLMLPPNTSVPFISPITGTRRIQSGSRSSGTRSRRPGDPGCGR